MSKIRFIDQVKVGTYKEGVHKGGDSIEIINNKLNYLLTATGDPNTIQGQSELMFVNNNLGIGVSDPQARLEVYESGSKDLLLIKNHTENGIQVTNQGIFRLLEFEELPSPTPGGIVYSKNNFWVGIKEEIMDEWVLENGNWNDDKNWVDNNNWKDN